MLRMGKYIGATFVDVAARDRAYCGWILREKPRSFKQFEQYLVETHGGVITVGKYKGAFFDEIMKEDIPSMGHFVAS